MALGLIGICPYVDVLRPVVGLIHNWHAEQCAAQRIAPIVLIKKDESVAWHAILQGTGVLGGYMLGSVSFRTQDGWSWMVANA